MIMEKRYTYNADFKRKVILCAENNGNRAAAKKFSINEANVRRWRKMRAELFACKTTTKSFSGPKSGKHPEIDSLILDYFQELRNKSFPVTREMIMSKAREIAKNVNISFKASRGWCEKFMKREGLTLRRRTTICQKLPNDFEEKLINFQRYVINLRRLHQYPLNQIVNADETAVYFDMPRNYTIQSRGEKEVAIKTTGYEKLRITVMLSVTGDGGKLNPYVILNRKTVPKLIFNKNVTVRAQKNAWMTSELMEDWLTNIWQRRPGALINRRSMLVMDAFRGHLTDKVKSLLRNKNCDVVIIPGGMTGQLQPLDISINKSFKGRIRKQYDEWLINNDHSYTKTGKIKKVSESTLVEWVDKAWKEVPNELIKKSFLKCCITNADDGTEDDILWNDAEEYHAQSIIEFNSDSENLDDEEYDPQSSIE